ncbi:MAG: hypothetical protein ABSA57_19580, partial [Candidatus Acidiferrales bacterium]
GFCQGLYEICKNEKPTQETEKNRVSNYLYASFETLCEIDGGTARHGGTAELAALRGTRDRRHLIRA